MDPATRGGERPVRYDVPLTPATIVRHRPEVVRRLIERGLSARTLSLLLPEWSDTIELVDTRA